MGGPVAGLPLLARVDLLLRRHVLLAAYAEVALDRAAAHRAPVELAEARGADAGVPARQQGARQREVLADDAELLAGGVPERAALLVAALAGRHQGAAAAGAGAAAGDVIVVARLGEREGRRAQARRRHRIALVVVARVARGQVQLL